MSDETEPHPKQLTRTDARRQRLAEALRRNLKRRRATETEKTIAGGAKARKSREPEQA